MDDLISRQAALDEIDGFLAADKYYHPYSQGKTIHVEEMRERLKQLPSAQPERKTGKWIMHIDDLFPAESTIECSECHHEQPLTIDDNFCPNCGADMRTPVEIARNIVHEAIDNSAYSDAVDTAEMHKVVDDKYAEIRG